MIKSHNNIIVLENEDKHVWITTIPNNSDEELKKASFVLTHKDDFKPENLDENGNTKIVNSCCTPLNKTPFIEAVKASGLALYGENTFVFIRTFLFKGTEDGIRLLVPISPFEIFKAENMTIEKKRFDNDFEIRDFEVIHEIENTKLPILQLQYKEYKIIATSARMDDELDFKDGVKILTLAFDELVGTSGEKKKVNVSIMSDVLNRWAFRSVIGDETLQKYESNSLIIWSVLKGNKEIGYEFLTPDQIEFVIGYSKKDSYRTMGSQIKSIKELN